MKIIERYATKCPCWATNIKQQGLAPEKRDARYQQYYKKYAEEGPDLMLHSLGCARASADYQAERWDVATNESVIAHAVIDSNDGNTRQTLRWDMRGWHCGSAANGSGNNTHIGVEMCESDQIVYRTDKPWLFSVKDRAKAEQHCRTAYNGAVELFAYLCKMFSLDPTKKIISHKEGHVLGIASNHGDPEHYWTGLGMPYTMNGFRADVKRKMEEDTMTRDQVSELIAAALVPINEGLAALSGAISVLSSGLSVIRENNASLSDAVNDIRAELGKDQKLTHIDDIPWKTVRAAIRELVEAGYINGGTPPEEDPEDINLGLEDVRVIALLKKYIDDKLGGGHDA